MKHMEVVCSIFVFITTMFLLGVIIWYDGERQINRDRIYQQIEALNVRINDTNRRVDITQGAIRWGKHFLN